MEEGTAKEIWRAALGELELQVTRPYFDTYLKGTLGVSFEEGRFTVGAPNSFVTEWLRLKMRPRIEETLNGLLNRAVAAEFVVSASKDTLTPSRQAVGDIPGPDAPPWDDGPPQAPADALLNRNYTFDSLVVAKFNRVAHAAAQAIAEDGECPYNPLFIYGDAGLGKTHLLHAIGHLALARRRPMLYVGAEQFTTDYAEAARDRSFGRFRKKYRDVDLLMVDDIQFIGGKRQTQEGFFHIFNHLHETNRQVVVAGDRHPAEMEALDHRLVSRFEGGLLADITQPSLETRVDILRLKCSSMGVEVPASVLEMIGRLVDGSVRRLEGALHKVVALAPGRGEDRLPGYCNRGPRRHFGFARGRHHCGGDHRVYCRVLRPVDPGGDEQTAIEKLCPGQGCSNVPSEGRAEPLPNEDRGIIRRSDTGGSQRSLPEGKRTTAHQQVRPSGHIPDPRLLIQSHPRLTFIIRPTTGIQVTKTSSFTLNRNSS